MSDKRSLLKEGLYPFIALLIIAFFVSQSNAFVLWSDGKSQGESPLFTWTNGGSSSGFFGDPTNYASVVDTFEFMPANFLAETLAGAKTALTRDTLQFEITSKTGSIQGIVIEESGIFEINGSGAVRASGTLYVRNLDNALETAQIPVTISSTAPMASTGTGTVSGEWTGTASIDLSLFDWTHIGVSLTNNLVASNSSGLISSIKKSSVGTGSDDVNVQILIPEPATLAIFGLGALIFPFTTRKKAGLLVIVAVMCVLGFTAKSEAVSYVHNGSYSSALGYFGSPQLDENNTFIFTGLSFSAESLGGIVTSNDRLTIDIFADAGYEITSVGVVESGEYFISGQGRVTASGYFFVTDALTDLDAGGAKFSISPTMPVSTEGEGYWNGSAYVTDLHLTAITVTIDSTLLAEALDDMSAASISKINFSIPVTVQQLPEPATIALLAFGSLAFAAKKK